MSLKRPGSEEQVTGTVLATSDICSGKRPVLHHGESMLATAVLTGRRSVGQRVYFTSPIPHFQWHATRWRDKEDLFLSLWQREKLHSACQREAFWQQRLVEARWMQGQRSTFKDLLAIDDAILAPWACSGMIGSDASSLRLYWLLCSSVKERRFWSLRLSFFGDFPRTDVRSNQYRLLP